MRKLLVVVLFLNGILVAKSQNLTVEGTAPDLYITHTVAPKENFYSIARLYNQPPRSIASLNKIEMEKGLTIGQKVKIPLNAQNFDVSDNGNSQTSIPITHIVGKSETLFKIAGNNKETAQLIKKWNHLPSDNITPGTPLIVGHLKVNNAQSSVSFAKSNETIAASATPASKPVESAETKQPSGNENKEGPAVSSSTGPDGEAKASEGGTLNQDTQSKTNQEAIESTTQATSVRDTALAVISEESKKTGGIKADSTPKEKPVDREETSSKKIGDGEKAGQAENETANSTEGAFANLFEASVSQKSLATKSGEAATFKSTSGWQDKKYYVLMSNIAPGTILKISAAENKVVYAKVLGSMPEMKENDGLLLRVSNAAASRLGIIDPKFPVQISYYQ